MAVQPQTPHIEHIANGTTAGFNLGFDCDNQDHLIVLVNDVEPVVGAWSLTGGAVVFGAAPADGNKITIQRNTPFERKRDYQSYDNSFRPPVVNKDFDWIWLKLQELGVADWILGNRITALKSYVDEKDGQLQQNINNLKGYVDLKDDELRAYLMEEIRKQGVALDQLDDYYNYLMQRLAQIAVDRGWAASFVVSADGSTQQQINDRIGNIWYEKPSGYELNARVMLTNGDIVKSTVDGNANDPNVDMTGWELPQARDVFDASGLSQQQINSWLPLPTIDGAKGDGVNDDTDALQAYINKYRYVNLRGKHWKISRKLIIPSCRVIDLSGASLTADNGTDPIFEMQSAGESLSILHGGGLISGTADSFLKCTGSTTTPTSASHYARQIRLDGLYIVSPTIDKFLDLKDAVRQVFIDKVHAYTKNGISAVGKCVEVKATKSIIYGATDEAETYGLKLNSPAGTSFYNEGFHFTDCTIDNFNTTFDVTDIYALSVTGGHIGRSQVGDSVVAKFGRPTSTHCKDIKFTGVNINGPVVFIPTSGCDYYAQFTGCVSESATGANIDIRSFASNIKITGHTFHTSNNGVAVVCANGTNDISVNNISCDTTFIGAVQVLGSAGTGMLIDSIQYAGTGNAIYLERPVRLANVPINDATKDYIQKFNTGSIQGSHIVGANIASVNNWFAEGETGVIVCELNYTGASASQVLTITTPTGMSIPSGTGWSSGAIMLNTVDGRVSLAIPYIVTQDIPSGSITLKNDTGNTISLGYHSYFGFKRN